MWFENRILTDLRDRATYDSLSSAYVTYSVASSVDAPSALTFGPSYMTLAATYPGTVVLGQLNPEELFDSTC